jgi:exopolysaccharide biosynthesis polyprenyl glycosylphosphotransferase
MLQQQVYLIATIAMVVDALLVIGAAYSAYFYRHFESFGTWSMDTDVFCASVLLIMVLGNYVMGKFGLYGDQRPSGYLSLWWSIIKAVTIAFGFLAMGIFLFQEKDYSRLFMGAFAILCILLIGIFRSLTLLYFDKFSRRGFNLHTILVVSNRERGEFVTKLLNSQMSWGHEIIGRLALDRHDATDCEILGCIDNLPDILRSYTVDEVVFAIDGYRNIELRPHLETCKRVGVSARILPSLWSSGGARLSIERCQGVPFLTIGAGNFNATGLMDKRIFDIVGGFLGTLMFLLMYPWVALVIKLDSPGPVLFKQRRVGQHGRLFKLYKFRSMYVDAEELRRELMATNDMQGHMFKMKEDPRITRVGRWLRKTSLDEFPQFLNVLKGQMSLVGTRPPMVEEVEKYRPEHLKRIAAKPGITGLWQVSGRNKITNFEEVVALDCSYLENWRFLNDLKILAKTVIVVLQRKGAI